MFLMRSKFLKHSGHNLSYSVIRSIHKKNLDHISSQRHQRTSEEILTEYGYGYGNKLIFNTKIDEIKTKSGYRNDFIHSINKKIYCNKLQDILDRTQPLPLSLKYYNSSDVNVKREEDVQNSHENNQETKSENEVFTNFPLNINYPVKEEIPIIESTSKKLVNKASVIDQRIRKKYELLKNTTNWMSCYDNYEYDLNDIEEDETILEDWHVNYGTPDPSCKISSVPCGGCGALLHCKVKHKTFFMCHFV